jgi:malonate decarboxylase alpha subunit
VIEADKPFAVEPLFTRDPRHINDLQILIGMLAIRGVYQRHQVRSLNHGIGFDTAAIELLLPTYGESLGLRGKICEHWALNPHPTLIPAIESGWVKNIHSFGSEVGMDEYIRARPDVFFTGRDGSLFQSNLGVTHAGEVDVRIETRCGGFSLEEYVRERTGSILLRTASGRVLVQDPWATLPGVELR